MAALKTIVLSGAESSGKTTLGQWLSRRADILYVPEYARIYLEQHGADYNEQTLSKLWLEHLDFQKRQIQEKKDEILVLLDTDLFNYQIWFEEVFGTVPDQLHKFIAKEQHHVYLLCYPDLDWSPDPLRENPSNRLALFEKHRALVEKHNRPYQIVKGMGDIRKQNVEGALKKLQKQL